jgi:hypothetical protein
VLSDTPRASPDRPPPERENPADALAILMLRMISTRIHLLASAAALEAGASQDIANRAGRLAAEKFVDGAKDLLVEFGIDPAARDAASPPWPITSRI